MIIQNINDKLSIIYTPDRHANFNVIFNELGYNDQKGNIRENVKVERSSSYFPIGGFTQIETIKITENDKITHIMNDNFTFDYSSIDNFINKLKYFGSNYVIKIEDKNFIGPFFKDKEDSIKNSRKNTLIFKIKGSDNITPIIYDFLHKMKMNNARMLMPLIRKYVDVITLIKGKKHLLTGYANILGYLEFMKDLDPELLSNFDRKADSVVNLNNAMEKITLKVSLIMQEVLLLNFMINNRSYISTNNDNISNKPYILVNTKPIQLLNQKLPYFIAKYKDVSVFVIPLILKSEDSLKKLRGGFNLLS